MFAASCSLFHEETSKHVNTPTRNVYFLELSFCSANGGVKSTGIGDTS